MYKTFKKIFLRCCLPVCMWFTLGIQGGEAIDQASAATAINPQGVVYSPREGTYGGAGFVAFDQNGDPSQNAKDAVFEFSGLTNFPGTQGYVQIQVLDYGDQQSDQSKGARWINRVIVIPDNDPFDFLGDNGTPRYQWNVMAVTEWP